MWCKHCRQDTPGIRTPKQPGLRCGRCGAPLVELESARRASASHPAEVGLDLGPEAASAWQRDQDLHWLEADLGSTHRRQAAEPSRRPQWRFDAAHTTPPRPNYPRRRVKDRPASRSGILVRAIVWFGLAAMFAGGGLLAYAIAQENGDAWRMGLPTAAAGGTIFLCGLALQLERIWKNSRYAVQKLRQLDTQMQQLERTTTMLGVTSGPSSQAFYSHLAEGASPHILLADLKGQLDLMAMNFAGR